MTITPGTKLGRYQILAQLGAGGMGELYLAEDSKLLRQIALKVLSTEFCQDSRRTARFLREAQAASALNHPNICTIYEINDDYDPPFIAMEYVEGGTLAEKIDDGSFDAAEILDIALQVADALSEAHSHGIVHRDIKPANIIVNRRGQVKILDFGLAKRIAVESEADTQEYLSQAGMIVGTLAYMSPEQARALPVDVRTDVWSFGVVLYEMLTGRHPFAEPTSSDLLAAILRSEPEALGKFNSAVHPELERIVLKTLSKDRTERHASAKDLFADLKQLKKQLELPEAGRGNSATDRQTHTETKLFKSGTGEETSNLPPHNLSSRHTKLIGREKEIRQIKDLLRHDDVRLLTLTGAGGTGKTSLAQAIAREMLPEFANGVFFIELGAIRQPELVASTIAQPLGVKEAGGKPVFEALKDYLRDKHLLLVIDNFEQVLPAAPNIGELLTVGPLKVVMTSRALLHLSPEREFVVSPLAVPLENSKRSVEDLQEIGAVKLFVERARSARSSFALVEENARSVVEICTQLDGLPLAIELAAARVKILSAQTIRAKLGHSLKLLTGGPLDSPARQQTMRGAVEWSYELLTEEEKRLFRELAVFAGGFTLEAVEAICDCTSIEGIEVLDLITSLVDKSLIVSKVRTNRESRFRMLEVIREYADEASGVNGDAEEMRNRHAAYFLVLAEAEPHLDSAKAAEWVIRLEEEHDNLRAALRWSLEKDPEKAARLAAGLINFWILHGHLTQGREWLEEVLKRGNKISIAMRRKVLTAAGRMAQLQGDYERAAKLYEEGLAEAKIARDLPQMALSGRGLAATAYLQGDFKSARRFVEEALLISRELKDRFAIAASLNRLGDIARMEENYEVAHTLFEESIAIFRQLGDKNAVSNSLNNLGAVAFAVGEYRTAGAYFAEALTTAQEFGNKIVISYSLNGVAALAAECGDPKRAALLAGASKELHHSIGFQTEPAERRFRDAYLAALREALDEATLSVAYEQGRKLKLEEAITLALTFACQKIPIDIREA
ncbi:MAG TPA: protein kinase [Pyrinomonadaceae bacterium]|nr:protein kinase [Pyrinomonadaceae bacterium]